MKILNKDSHLQFQNGRPYPMKLHLYLEVCCKFTINSQYNSTQVLGYVPWHPYNDFNK